MEWRSKSICKNALSPSQVLEVIVDETNQSTVVVVPDYQLSLAIGKRGQNARLAAKLTGWKIDIKSETDAREAGIYPVVEAEKVTEEDVALEDADTTESTEEVNDVSVETNVEKESE